MKIVWRVVGFPLRLGIAIFPFLLIMLSALIIPGNSWERERAYRFWREFLLGI